MKNKFLIKRLIVSVFALGVLGFIIPQKAYATHFAAAQLYADYVSPRKYVITLELFADCSGITPATSYPVDYMSDCGTTTNTATLNQVAGTGNIVTGSLCANVQTNCTNPSSTLVGYRKYIYTKTVTLPYNCDSWYFTWTDCCRNPNIVNLTSPSSRNICIRLQMNTVTKPINNTPRFNSFAIQYFNLNHPQTYVNSPFDPDFDSMVTSSFVPSGNCTTGLPYAAGYSLANPIAASTANGGFVLDASTGAASFTPTVTGGFNLAFRISEYDATTGALTSRLDRDVQLFVVNSSAPPPLIDTFAVGSTHSQLNNLTGAIYNSYKPLKIEACAGRPFSFSVSGTGGDTASQTYVYSDAATTTPGATFATSGNSTNNVSGNFNWTPTLADTGKHILTITFMDSTCSSYLPLVLKSYIILTIDVKWGSIEAGPNKSICPGDTATISTTNTSNVNTWNWTVAGGGIPTNLAVNGNPNVSVWPTSTTSYIVNTNLSPACKNTDTVNVMVAPPLVFSSLQINSGCNSPTGTVTAVVTGGNTPYTYSLDGSPFQSSSTFNSVATGTHTITVKDANNCTGDTSFTIVIAPPITFSSASKVNVSCFGGSNGSISVTAAGGTPGFTYSINNGAYQSSGNFTGLSAGTYTLRAKDANGCTHDTTITITQPTKVTAASISITMASCNQNNGVINVTGGGGTPGYTYALNTGSYQSSGNFTSLATGTYTIHIKDSKGCIRDTTITLNAINSVQITNIAFTQPSCFGGSNGTITVTASSGGTPYTYALGTGAYQSSNTFSNLAAGTYTVKVKDANGCIATGTVTITQPTKLSVASMTISQVSCNGGANGSITISGSGGTPGYTYALGSGAYGSSSTFNNLAAGTYTLHIKDSKGCIKDTTVTITAPSVLNATASQKVNVSCNGGNNGSVTITGSGGTPPYTYRQGSGAYQSSGSFTGLASGTYTFTVKDAKGCTKNVSVTITQPTPVAVGSVSTTLATCNQNNGSITITGAGGTPGYTYAINTGTYQSTGSFTGLASGTYTVHIKDSKGCIKDTVISVVAANVVQISNITFTQPSCFGGNNGSITVTASNGLAPYTYALGSGAYQNGNTFSNIAAGTYTIKVKDANGCIVTGTVTVTQPTQVKFGTISKTNIACNGNTTGSITVTGSGGTPGYTYALGTGAYSSNSTFSNLGAGTYTIRVKDSKGCIGDTTVTIIQAPVLGISVSTVTMVSCNGGNNGTVTVAGVGGTSPYTYSRNGGTYQSSGNFTGLSAGTYTFTVKDANGCLHDTTVTITQPTPVSLASATITTTTCNLSNGTVTISGTGGSPGYTYSRGTGAYQTSGTFSGLAAGTYVFHIKDSKGCIFDTTLTVTALNSVILDSIDMVQPSCYGGSNGTVKLFASAGTPPYTYAKGTGPFQTSNTFNNLTAGFYTFQIKDASGCVIQINVTVTQPLPLIFNTITKTNVTCYGQNTGAISVSAAGGTPGYTYAIGTGAFGSNSSFNNLAAGTYTLHIKDAVGCSHDTTFTITQPSNLIIHIDSAINPKCNGQSNGKIVVSGSGGTSGYQYALGTGAYQSSGIFTGLPAGNYVLHLKDANGCTRDTTITLNATGAMQITNMNIQNVLCYGDSTGSIQVSATGGTSPYAYILNSGTPQTTNSFGGLPAGNYIITVKDIYNCQVDSSVVISQPAQIQIQGIVNNSVCNSGNNGTLTITAINGISPYTISLNPGGSSSTGIYTGLGAGTYVATVTDSAGCQAQSSFVLTDPPAIVPNFTAVNVQCFGENNGSITVTPSFGTAPYTYSLNSGAYGSSNVFSGLVAGTYTISILDANLCNADTTITITQPADLNLVANVANISCHGANDGKITITSSTGGTAPYTYKLDNNPYTSSLNFGSVTPGVHTITIKDANGCTKDFVYNIIEPPALQISLTIVEPICTSKGSVSITATGGSLPLTYSLNGINQSTGIFTNVDSGQYLVTVTDNNGCSSDTNIYLSPPKYPSIDSVLINGSLCHGDNKGSIKIYASSSSPTLEYAISPSFNFGPNNTFGDLSAGTYTISVQDLEKCRADSNVNVVDPDELKVDMQITHNNCATAEPDGSLMAVVSGGTKPYKYQWSHITTDTALASFLANGYYTLTVLDSNGCSTTSTYEIIEDNCCQPFIPNAFTPNEDGKNDHFTVYNLDEMNYMKVRIFNRYGQQVYYGYNEADWDGTFKGKPVDIGVYVVKITYSCRGWNDLDIEYVGEVHLIR